MIDEISSWEAESEMDEMQRKLTEEWTQEQYKEMERRSFIEERRAEIALLKKIKEGAELDNLTGADFKNTTTLRWEIFAQGKMSKEKIIRFLKAVNEPGKRLLFKLEKDEAVEETDLLQIHDKEAGRVFVWLGVALMELRSVLTGIPKDKWLFFLKKIYSQS